MREAGREIFSHFGYYPGYNGAKGFTKSNPTIAFKDCELVGKPADIPVSKPRDKSAEPVQKPAEKPVQNPPEPVKELITFYAVVNRSYQLGDVGRFPKSNPLTQSWKLKGLSRDMIGYTCLCVKVRKDGAIVAQVRQVDRESAHSGRGDGMGVYFSRAFVVKGIDVKGLKDRSVWDPGTTEFKVVGTEKDKAGALFLVFEPVKSDKEK